jgi:hypothetical protein
MKNRWQLLSLLAAVLACTALAQTQPGHSLLRNVGLYETPAPYAELTFSKPGDLPTALTRPGESVRVSFGIHNVSGDARNYAWSIVLMHAGKNTVTASGSVQTPAQGRSAVAKSVVPACVSGRLQVVVRLASPAESISFWMTCPPAPASKKAGQ